MPYALAISLWVTFGNFNQVGIIATNFIGAPVSEGNQSISPDERPIATQARGGRPQKHTGKWMLMNFDRDSWFPSWVLRLVLCHSHGRYII